MIYLVCKCESCWRGALNIAERHPDLELEEPMGTSCRRDRIDPVLIPIICVHCGSDRVDLGRTGLHLCEDCGGLFREQERAERMATDRQARIEETLR